MKRITLFCFAATLFAVLGISPVSAQIVQYDEYETVDNVRLEYRWQREKFLRRDSNALLNLKLTNLSDAHVEVHFTVGFYRDEQLFFESQEQSFCLGPWESIRGGRAGLRFSAEDIRMDTIEKEWFSWDLPRMEVRITDECK